MKFILLNRIPVQLIPAIVLLLSVTLQGQTPDPKPLPIYEQCPALSSEAGNDERVNRFIALLTDKDPAARIEAARQLSSTCDKRAIDPLIDRLKDEDFKVRIAAIEALGKLGDNDSVSFLIDAIFDGDWQVKSALVSSLASFKLFKARNMVVNGIANPNNQDITDINDMLVRCSAILTVNQLKDVSHSRKSILFLHGWLVSSHAPIREMAEKTMYALRDTRNGATELMALLKQSNDPHLRKWTAEWLGRLKIERARDVLENASQNDTDSGVQQAAKEALKSLDNAK